MLHLHEVVGRPWAVQGEVAHQVRDLYNRGGIAALRQLAEVRALISQKRLDALESAWTAAFESPEARIIAGPKEREDGPTAGPRSNTRRAGNVAVIPLFGMITHRGEIVDCAPTASSMAYGQEVRAAAADAQIEAIVLEGDTPGGEVIGVPEAAAAIRDARAVKPVVAVANGVAASAGYWLLSQADEFLVTLSGMVGSIGVYGLHEDVSQALAAQGVKVTLVSAGKYKVEGNSFEPFSDEARGAMQADVNRYYDMFVKDVARGRKVSVDAVRGGFGEGRMVGAKAAVDQGMATGIGGVEEAVRRASALARERAKGGASAMTVAEAQALRLRRDRAEG